MSALYKVRKTEQTDGELNLTFKQICEGLNDGSLTYDDMFCSVYDTEWKQLRYLGGIRTDEIKSEKKASCPPIKNKPYNYLVWSIILTMFCFPPIGIFAIFSAASVDSLWIEKKYKEADIASKNAERFCMITFMAGLVAGIIYLSI